MPSLERTGAGPRPGDGPDDPIASAPMADLLEYFAYETDGPVATITFNRPERRNGINGTMLAELHDLLHRARHDRELRALILTGTGNSFCAGAEPAAVAERSKAKVTSGGAGGPREIGRVFDTLAHLDLMTIGALNGHAVGGGWSLALAVDYAVAVPEAEFWVPEVDLGVPFRGLPAIAIASRMGPWLAKEATILCRRFSAQELCDLRVINRVVPAAELMDVARAVAAEFASKVPRAASATKRDVNAVFFGTKHY